MNNKILKILLIIILSFLSKEICGDGSTVYNINKNNEYFITCIFYLLPLLFSFYIIVKVVTDRFMKVYFYYYYRVENRGGYFNLIVKKIIMYVIFCSMIRYGTYIIIDDFILVIDRLIYSFTYYCLVLLFLVLVGSVLFIWIRKDYILSYFFAFIILIAGMFFTFKNDYVYLFTLNDIGYCEIISLIVLNVIIYFIGKKLLKHVYYY